MAKTVILIRHAKSSWNDPGARDFDRALNDRGRRDAPLMGRRLADFLADAGLSLDLFLCSGANRAMQSAALIAPELGYDAATIAWRESLYLADAGSMLDAIRKLPDQAACVALLAHNPGITILAERISGRMFTNVPTCGVIVVRFEQPSEVMSWREIALPGALQLFDYPKRMPG